MTIYTLIPEQTVGCYAHDEEGNPWASFQIMNGTETCTECGATISGGWVRGKLFDEQFHVCSSHVRFEGLYRRLKSGETLHVLARRTGKQFSIKPVEWEGLILGYSVLVDDEVVPGYDGLLLDTDTVKDWLNQVEEV